MTINVGLETLHHTMNDKGKQPMNKARQQHDEDEREGPIDLDEYKTEKHSRMNKPFMQQDSADTDEVIPHSKNHRSTMTDDFGGTETRSSGRKRKLAQHEKNKQRKLSSIAATAVSLLDHLKSDSMRREKNDRALVASLDKIADSSVLIAKSMQVVADALLALVARQASIPL